MTELTNDEVAALLAVAVIKNEGELRFTREDVESLTEKPMDLVIEMDEETSELVVLLRDSDEQ